MEQLHLNLEIEGEFYFPETPFISLLEDTDDESTQNPIRQ